DYEGCLSVPEIYGMVPRATKVKVKARLEDGTDVRIKATGELARTLLHEIDHLDGILFIDHVRDDSNAFYRMNKKGDLEPIKDYEKEIRDNDMLWGEE
ncbi:peptide deformylase, partial [Candidatus Saccharibacteria bacterium]|nr:peptide deformylase [Candidatus Saccharibacteria bacterium]